MESNKWIVVAAVMVVAVLMAFAGISVSNSMQEKSDLEVKLNETKFLSQAQVAILHRSLDETCKRISFIQFGSSSYFPVGKALIQDHNDTNFNWLLVCFTPDGKNRTIGGYESNSYWLKFTEAYNSSYNATG